MADRNQKTGHDAGKERERTENERKTTSSNAGKSNSGNIGSEREEGRTGTNPRQREEDRREDKTQR